MDRSTSGARNSTILDATNPDLSGFQKRGGKLTIVIGTNDTLASPGAQLDYYQSVWPRLRRDPGRPLDLPLRAPISRSAQAGVAAAAGLRRRRRAYCGGRTEVVFAYHETNAITQSESKVASVRRLVMSLMVIAALSGLTGAQTRNNLVNGCRAAPRRAQPRVWWHWMNANIIKDGIQLDLDG